MFSGIYYPVSVLPDWAQVVAAGIPLTYFLDAFRQGYGFEAQFAHAWLKGFALTGPLRRARALGAGLGHHPLAAHRASPQALGVTP